MTDFCSVIFQHCFEINHIFSVSIHTPMLREKCTLSDEGGSNFSEGGTGEEKYEPTEE